MSAHGLVAVTAMDVMPKLDMVSLPARLTGRRRTIGADFGADVVDSVDVALPGLRPTVSGNTAGEPQHAVDAELGDGSGAVGRGEGASSAGIAGNGTSAVRVMGTPPGLDLPSCLFLDDISKPTRCSDGETRVPCVQAGMRRRTLVAPATHSVAPHLNPALSSSLPFPACPALREKPPSG